MLLVNIVDNIVLFIDYDEFDGLRARIYTDTVHADPLSNGRAVSCLSEIIFIKSAHW